MPNIEIYADTRNVGRCRDEDCRKRITFAQVVKTGRTICFDGEPVPLRTRHSDDRRLIEEIDGDEVHFARCPGADRFRRKR